MNVMNVTKADTLRFGTALVLGCVLASPASSEISADQIARLGADLTPLGGERAGNADGTIPTWTGGITEPPAGYTVGEHHRDPYAGDEPLFVIRRRQPRRAPRPALDRTPAHAGDLPELQHAGPIPPGAAPPPRSGSTTPPATPPPPRSSWTTATEWATR